MGRLSGHILTVLVAVVVLGVFFGALLVSGGESPSLTSGGYKLSAVVPNSQSLGPGGEVRIAGLRVGNVTEIDKLGTTAIVEMDIEDEHKDLRKDTEFSVRLRSLVGENYIELYPGTGRQRLEDGATLPMAQLRDEYVDVEAILDQLKGPTRDRARALLQGFGRGLDNRGKELNQTLDEFAGFVEEAVPLVKQLNQDRNATARLIDEVGQVSRAIGDRGQAIRSLARSGTVTFQAIADRDQALRAMFEKLPPTFVQLRETAGTLRTVTRQATPLVRDLTGTVRAAEPLVKQIGPGSRELVETITLVRLLRPAAIPMLRQVKNLRGPTQRALPQVVKAMCEVNPLLRYLEPYADIVGGVLANMGSAGNYYDAGGHSVRLSAVVAENSFGFFDPGIDQALKAVLDASVSSGHVIGLNPIPRPEDATQNVPNHGKGFTGTDDYGKGGRRYPRIMAEC